MSLAVKETETKNLLETLANKSPVGLYIVQDGKFCYTNPTFQSITGYTEDELVGRDALDFVVPEDKERVRENAIKMLKGGLTLPYQFRVTHRNGSIKWVMESVVPIQYLRRRATMGDFIDITERKQVEEKVQHLNLLLQAIRNINQLIARGTDRDGLLKGACDTFVETRGYYSAWIALLDESGKLVTAVEAGLGKSFLQVTERLKRGELMHCGCKVLEKAGVLVMEDMSTECEDCPVAKEDTSRGAMSVRLEYGSKLYGLMTVSISPGRVAEKEEYDLLEEIAEDIAFALHSMEQEHEHKRAEEARREAEEEKSAFLEEAPVSIVHTDLKGKITYVNKRFESESGYSRKEISGKSAFQLDWFPAGTMKYLTKRMAARLRGSPAKHWETQFKSKDGRQIWVEIEGKVLGRLGVPIGFQIIAVNTTERKQAEETLQAEKNKLQSLVNAMEDTVTIQDPEYNIIYQNEPSRIASGGYHLGEKCYRVYEGRETVCNGCPVEKAFKDSKSHTAERMTTINGKVTFWENTANPIRDAEGKIVSCLEITRDITERKKAEEELRKTQAQLSSAVQMAHLGPWEYDAINDLFIFNDAFYELFHTTAEEVGGYTMSSAEYTRRFVHPEDSHLVGEEIRKAVQVDDPNFTRQLDHRIIYGDGEVGYISVHFFVTKDEAGITVGTLGVNQDITERKRAEEVLQTERNKLQSVIDAMEDGLTIQDRDYNIIYEGRVQRSIVGEHLGEKCYRIYAGKEKICEGCPVEKAFKDGKSHTAERRMVEPSGKISFWENIANPIRDASGEIVSCLEINRNITERKKQEQALVDEATRWRILVDKSLDGIVVLDVDAKVVEANQRFADMLGYTLEEVYKLHTWDWDKQFPPEKIREMGRNVDEKGLHLETKHTRKDGSVIDVDISISGIIYGGQKLIFCIQRDVTERNRGEKAIRDSEESYRELANSITEVFFAMDEHLKYTYWNKASEILTGIREEDAIGKSLSEVFPDSPGLRRAEKVYRAVLKTKKSRTFINDFDIDGSHYVFEISAYPSRGGISVFVRDITERKRTEQALADELTRRRLLIDQSVDGIVIIDENDKVYEANQRFAEMLGYTLEEVQELHTWDWDKNFSREQIHEMGRKADEKGFLLDTTHTRKDGSIIDVDISINASMIRGQKLIFCVCRDVTERKKAEQALADELAQRRILIDQSLDGIVVLDADAKVVEANQHFAEMLGYTLEEIQELHTWDWDKNFSREKILKMGQDVDENGLHLETKHTRKDGSIIDVDISISGVMYRGQKLILCIQRDVTERKKMEEALKLAAKEWRETFDSMSDGISIHDRDYKILRANKAFADIFNMEPTQIASNYCYQLHKGSKPIKGCPHQQTLATKKPAAAEFYESNLGKYLHESTSPIFNEKGEVVSTVHITSDITEQKQQNERLMMADRLASIGELASGAAHELNNPLTSIIGFSQLLMEKDMPDDIRDDVKLIYNEAQRAVNVTRNFLTFARKHIPVKEPNQINNIIEDVLELHAHEQQANNIHVEKHLAPNLPEIMVDYFQMQQVFMNIIINAEYFMIEAHHAGTLTITTNKQNSNVRISIADDGPGIPPENLGRLFNPFFTTKEAGKGTGLGLSICHGIVTEHGGQIYARSQLGNGATIFIDLPIKSLTNFKSLL